MECISYRLSTGQKTYSLFVDGNEVHGFNCYINDVARTSSHNTTKCVAADLRIFFQYLLSFDDVEALASISLRLLTGDFLTEAVQQFPQYLALGIDAPESSLANFAAIRTGRKPTSHATNQRAISSLKGFLNASARLQAEFQQAEELELIDVAVAPDALFGKTLRRTEIPITQRRALLKKSMIAGVVRYGPLLANSALLKARKYSIGNRDFGSSRKKAIPHELVLPLLNAATTLRDRLLWLLLLGTGLRPVEGLSLLIQDIDIEKQDILCINPASRPHVYTCSEFEELQGQLANDMAFKGRTTEQTLFIEPFKTYFFETLGRYLREERQPIGCDHSFLFVVLKAPYSGRPLVMSSQATRIHSIKQALESVCSNLKIDTPKRMALHACRHFYGVHCLNYLITHYDSNDKPVRGLNKYVVQCLMGHQDISSTEVYARPCIDLVQAQIQQAMNQLDYFAIESLVTGLSDLKVGHFK